MKILCAVVTHNRAALLSRCIDKVLLQTRPVDSLVIINNGSTDDTVAMLERRGVEFITQANVGSAGGWRRAIEHAQEHGFDCVWLMDDDGYPAPDALENLLPMMAEGVGCASSVVLREDKPTHFVFPFAALNKRGLPALVGKPRTYTTLAELKRFGPTYPFAHLFNGALLSVEATRQIGSVELNYFLYGDEVDYQMRMRKRFSVISVLSAHHYHPDVSNRPMGETKVYYSLKNKMIINRRYFDRPNIRNIIAVGLVLLRIARRNGPGEALSYIGGRRTPLLWKAATRGLRGQLGKDL